MTGDISGKNPDENAGENILSFGGMQMSKKYIAAPVGSKQMRVLSSAPEVRYSFCPGQLHAIAFIGTPARKEFSIFPAEFLWFVVNIREDNVYSGDCLWEYRAPNPPKNIAYKYSLIIYKQSGIITAQSANSIKNLPGNFSDFIRKHKLEKLDSDYIIVKIQ